jgi:hypothetical protein
MTCPVLFFVGANAAAPDIMRSKKLVATHRELTLLLRRRIYGS